jgi:fucose permease
MMVEPRVGGLLAALNLALIPMMLASGVLVEKLGVRWVLVGGSLLAAVAIFSLGMSLTYRGALSALLVIGIGGACLNTAALVLMPNAFFGSAAASVNLGMVFFGLGALATPALAEVLIRGIGLRWALCLLGALCLIPAVAAAFNSPAAFNLGSDQPADLAQVLTDPVVWLSALGFMLYWPLEGALATWATTYLTEMGDRPRRVALGLSGFWLAFLGMRLLFSYLQYREILPRDSEAWVILGLALAAGVVLSNLAGTRNTGVARSGLMMVGALLGPILPTLVGILFENTRSPRGTAYGVMFAVGATGSLVLPPMIGAYARRRSVRAALRIPAVVALALAGAALVMALAL